MLNITTISSGKITCHVVNWTIMEVNKGVLGTITRDLTLTL